MGMEYRYWLTFSDMDVVPKGELVEEHPFDPRQDCNAMDKDEEKLYKSDDPFVVVGVPVDGKFASFDPTGVWTGDMQTATGEVKRWLKRIEYTCVKNGSVYESTCSYKMNMMCFGYNGTSTNTTQPIPDETGAFMTISSDGEYIKSTINSLDSATAMDMSGKWSITFNRSK